jgi:hypothetical protein
MTMERIELARGSNRAIGSIKHSRSIFAKKKTLLKARKCKSVVTKQAEIMQKLAEIAARN